MRMTRTLANILINILTVLTAIVLPILIGIGVFFLSFYTPTANDKYEDHLLIAKQRVAKEIGYTGSLNSDCFRIYRSNAGGYSYTISKIVEGDSSVIVDSGSFSDKKAIKELEKALEYDDHHESLVESFGDTIDWLLSSIFLAGIAWIAAIIGTLYGFARLKEELEPKLEKLPS